MNFETARKQGKVFVIGCDPGPVSSALVLISYTGGEVDIRSAAYLRNETIGGAAIAEGFLGGVPGGSPCFLAYEAVGAQGKFCGESTFETAAMGGEIRRAFRPYVTGPAYRFVSSDWRHALTGQGNAKTPLVYHEICKRFPTVGGGSDPYKGTAKQPGPLWALATAGKGGNVEHLKDALGVALGLDMVRFRSGRDPEDYRRPW